MVTIALLVALLVVNLDAVKWENLSRERIAQVALFIGIAVTLTTLVVLLAIGGASLGWTGFQGKTVWDFLQLLIVPLMLVAIGLVFSLQQDARQQRVEDQRAEAERDLAAQRAQDEALQAYLNQMSQLLLDRKLLEAEQGTPLYTLAQARSSTAILRSNAEHNESVTRFLSESGLAVRSETSAGLLSEVVLSHAKLSGAYLPNANLLQADLHGTDLHGADLDEAMLLRAYLGGANLSGADLYGANLSEAYLSNANLSDAYLEDIDLSITYLNKANLSGADLRYADLSGADLSGANLSGAKLQGANLSCARWGRTKHKGGVTTLAGKSCSDLSGADLSEAHLYAKDARVHGLTISETMANLTEADLTGANLKGATVLKEQLIKVKSLEGATMPNGQKYEDWHKDREKRQQDE